VDGHLPLQYAHIGEQQVKNIAKPVRAYHVLFDAIPYKPSGTSPINRRNIAIGAAALFVAFIAIGVAWKAQKPPSHTPPTIVSQKPRLAVLSLDNFSPHSEDEYFSDGMTEELISRLSRVGGLDVIARTSVMQYKGKNKSIADIARELNVDNILV
jgi:adenylate cyclase